jgi:hypothetical protein
LASERAPRLISWLNFLLAGMKAYGIRLATQLSSKSESTHFSDLGPEFTSVTAEKSEESDLTMNSE